MIDIGEIKSFVKEYEKKRSTLIMCVKSDESNGIVFVFNKDRNGVNVHFVDLHEEGGVVRGTSVPEGKTVFDDGSPSLFEFRLGTSVNKDK